MQFSVRMIAPDLSIVCRVIDARDEAGARSQVEASGMFISEIKPLRSKSLRGARRAPLHLVLFSQELLALLNAGLSIVESLEALREKESNPVTRDMLGRLLVGLHDGLRFSAALADQSPFFPALFLGIVRAAEGTSDLPRALSRYIDYQQRIDQVRAKLVSASIYPMILMLVGTAVALFLVGYVVPRFAEVYQGAAQNLPWASRLMLDWGQFVARHGAVLAPGGLITLIVISLLVRKYFSVKGVSRLLMRVPVIGERVRIYELSRLYLTLGMLAEGGMTVVRAIDTVESMVLPSMRIALRVARNSIEAGISMSSAFEQNGLTTPISLRMLRVGERTGEMAPMLMQSAAFYDGETSRWLDRFTRTFEPLLMAAIGLVVGGIVLLLYMPIFDLAGSMN